MDLINMPWKKRKPTTTPVPKATHKPKIRSKMSWGTLYMMVGTFWGALCGEIQSRLYKKNVGVVVLINSFMWPISMIFGILWLRKRRNPDPVRQVNFPISFNRKK